MLSERLSAVGHFAPGTAGEQCSCRRGLSAAPALPAAGPAAQPGQLLPEQQPRLRHTRSSRTLTRSTIPCRVGQADAGFVPSRLPGLSSGDPHRGGSATRTPGSAGIQDGLGEGGGKVPPEVPAFRPSSRAGRASRAWLRPRIATSARRRRRPPPEGSWGGPGAGPCMAAAGFGFPRPHARSRWLQGAARGRDLPAAPPSRVRRADPREGSRTPSWREDCGPRVPAVAGGWRHRLCTSVSPSQEWGFNGTHLTGCCEDTGVGGRPTRPARLGCSHTQLPQPGVPGKGRRRARTQGAGGTKAGGRQVAERTGERRAY